MWSLFQNEILFYFKAFEEFHNFYKTHGHRLAGVRLEPIKSKFKSVLTVFIVNYLNICELNHRSRLSIARLFEFVNCTQHLSLRKTTKKKLYSIKIIVRNNLMLIHERCAVRLCACRFVSCS